MSPTHVLKIATLNLWRYTNWEKRLPLLIELFKKNDPDIILLQEVQRDSDYGDKDQATVLAEELNYPFADFEVACIKTIRKGIPLSHPIEHGLGILSKMPFKITSTPLNKAENDTETRILVTADFETENGKISISNIHFANKDDWAEEHLKETLNILKAKNIKSILAGDFNIKNLSAYKNLYEKEYVSAADMFQYISYPKDTLSYDHILIPHKYSFIDFKCLNEEVSDHKLLCAEIGLE